VLFNARSGNLDSIEGDGQVQTVNFNGNTEWLSVSFA